MMGNETRAVRVRKGLKSVSGSDGRLDLEPQPGSTNLQSLRMGI